MNIPPATTGELIRLNRLRLGLTQQQLTDLLNSDLPSAEILERTMISRWERDQHFPRNGKKELLEKHLGVELGNPPLRRESFAAYLNSRPEIQKSFLLGLEDCDELWLTTSMRTDNIWHEIREVKQKLDKLRQSKTCLYKELIYISNLDDLANVKKLIEQGYPNHLVRVRVAPGHPLPVLLAPNRRFGLFLSGFGDDIASVGLELNGQIAGFIEYYFRHLWETATPLLEKHSVVSQGNIEKVSKTLEGLGGKSLTSFTKKN